MKTYYFIKFSTKKIFFLILIIPVIIQLLLINIVQSIENNLLYYLTFVIFWMLYLPFFYWLNNSITFLYNHSSKYLNLKLINFKFSLLINIIITLNFVFFVAYIFSFFHKGSTPNTVIITLFIAIQFIGIFAFMYSSYFVCKVIKTIELKNKVFLNDILPIFLYYSFPPITIWVIHNKIKEFHHLEKDNY